MIKRTSIIVCVVMLSILAGLMLQGINKKLAAKREAFEKVRSLPVNANLFTLDSIEFRFPVGKPIVLILFNSTCGYCVKELDQIQANIGKFDVVELVFLSGEPISVIKGVAMMFISADNVNFVKMNADDLYENFGAVRFPTIFIYNTTGQLVKEFKGETKAQAILMYVRH
jgi:thiol-disulfide isomerase/thioredoxin